MPRLWCWRSWRCSTTRTKTFRGAAVGALGMIGPLAKSAVPALLQIVAEGTGWREEAVRSLGLMGPEAREAVPDLVSIVLDGDCGDLRGKSADSEPRNGAAGTLKSLHRPQ